MAFTEDLSLFFETDDFAVEAIFGTKKVNVIFNTPTQEVTVYDQEIVSDAPFLTCRTSDLSGVAPRSPVKVGGTTYTIARITNDGTGVSQVYLK